MSYVQRSDDAAVLAWNTQPDRGNCWTPIDGATRDASLRGWKVRCACGRTGLVADGVDGVPYADGHLEDFTVTFGEPACGKCGAIVGFQCVCKEEVTRTTLNDLLKASERYLMLAYADDIVQWHRDFPDACKRADEERAARFRAAMQGMANVMAGVMSTLERIAREDDCFMVRQRHDSRVDMASDKVGSRQRASGRWSERVREGVKALRPLGPVVACQGDWEDD